MKVDRFSKHNVEDNVTVYFRHVVTLPTDVRGVVIYVGIDQVSTVLGGGTFPDVLRVADEITKAFEEKAQIIRPAKPKAKKKARRKK